MAKKLFLIDGSNHAFRVFHAMPRNMFAAGFPTGALLGFANMLRRLENEFQPDYMVVVFDKGKSFRVDLFPDYKGHRPEKPEELDLQWPHFQSLIEAWGCPYLAMEGVEADDVIGTLAKRFGGPDVDVTLVTGDKDFYQLVGGPIRVLDIMKDQLLDAEAVATKMHGVGPDRITDLKGLAGDSSDNLPGVPGVGDKTAAKYLAQYGTAEAVVEAAQAGKIKGKRGAAVAEHADMVALCKTLATIKLDCEIDLSLEDLAAKDRDVKTLRQLFMKWQFRTHLKELQEAEAAATSELDPSVYRQVTTAEGLRDVVASIRDAARRMIPVTLAPETSGSDPMVDTLTGMGLCWGPRDAVFVRLPEDQLLAGLGPLLEDPRVPKSGHELKTLHRLLARRGMRLRGQMGDTMLADYLLEPARNNHRLQDLSLRYLGHTLGGSQPAQTGLFAAAEPNAAEPAHVGWLLQRELAGRMDEMCVSGVLRDVELPLVPLLAKLESAGLCVDTDKLQAMSVEYQARAAEVQARAFEVVGREFNLGSTKDLRQILFTELDLPVVKKTPKGAPSTDHSVLEQLADDHELPSLIVEHRRLIKLDNTYLSALPTFVHPDTGRVHTTLHQEVAETGRLSSSNPNLQNIPIRSAEGRRIRDCFVAAPDTVLLSCDYSQVELRILAHFCGSGSLMDAFVQGQDIHARTASEIFEVPLDQVTKDQRGSAKAINFGLIYGMAPPRLARDLKISVDQARGYIERYFARMPEVKGYLDQAVQDAKDTGYARTLWGRRRTITHLNSRNWQARSLSERLARNTPIQGSAADLIKLAMVAVDKRLEREFFGVRMLLQIHDELLFEVPKGLEQAVADAVREEMEGIAPLRVPLKVDAGWGPTWTDAH